MRKQKHNAIGWCHETRNPITGCLHGCSYCYVPRVKGRFEKDPMKPAFHPERLERMRKELATTEPSRVFVGSCADMFGEWVRPGADVTPDHVRQVLDVCSKLPQHKFIMLTRNPARLADYDLPSNLWAGISVSDIEKRDMLALNERVDIYTAAVPPGRRVLSLEPLTTTYFDSSWSAPVLVTAWMGLMDWVIIGGLTGKGARPTERDELQYLVEFAHKECGDGSTIPLFVKSNAVADTADPLRVQEYPEGLRLA